MKFREKAVKTLYSQGLFEDQAKEIVEKYINSPAGELMKDRMDDDESGYPAQFFSVIWIGVKVVAVDWIDENCPKHWARPMFTN